TPRDLHSFPTRRSSDLDKIDNFMQQNGGFLRKIDFEKHTSTWVDSVSTNYRGYDVFELPPNGQGIATLQILNILEGFDLKAMGRSEEHTSELQSLRHLV